MKDLTHNIKGIRAYKGFSQEDMAEKLGMTQAGYFKIESGKTKITEKRLEQIAKVLEVTVEEVKNWDAANTGETGEIEALRNEIQYLKTIITQKDELFDYRIDGLHGAIDNFQQDLLNAIAKKYNLDFFQLHELYREELRKQKVLYKLLERRKDVNT